MRQQYYLRQRANVGIVDDKFYQTVMAKVMTIRSIKSIVGLTRENVNTSVKYLLDNDFIIDSFDVNNNFSFTKKGKAYSQSGYYYHIIASIKIPFCCRFDVIATNIISVFVLSPKSHKFTYKSMNLSNLKYLQYITPN